MMSAHSIRLGETYARLDNRLTILGRRTQCAVNITSGRIVVLKNSHRKHEATSTRLQNEIQILTEIHCYKPIATIIELGGGGSPNDACFTLITPFIDGGNLRRHMDEFGKAGVPESHVRDIALAVTRALHELHNRRRPISHNDLNPDKILLGRDGRIVLSGFEFSRVLDSPAAVLVQAEGEPNYFSPEKASSPCFNHQSDVWSLGVVLLKCCLGTSDFDVAKLDVTSLLANYSAECLTFIFACLEVDVRSRPLATELLEYPFVKDVRPSGFDVTPVVFPSALVAEACSKLLEIGPLTESQLDGLSRTAGCNAREFVHLFDSVSPDVALSLCAGDAFGI